ncbi:hypothetical protein [Sulfurisphaera ohwakuensis]|uniref:hypothetical protein n=1 Tax=Sulfurisphaera ohwakuensis TaxID=69656 RepID=UPI0036F3351D
MNISINWKIWIVVILSIIFGVEWFIYSLTGSLTVTFESLGGVAAAAALIATIYYYSKQLEEMRKKTELRAELDFTFLDKSVPLNIPSLQDATGKIIIQGIQGSAKIIRINVFNVGPVTAKECIPKVRIFRNDSWEGFGGVMLHWIRYRELIRVTRIEDLYRPIDIAAKDNEIADVVFIVKTDRENFAALRTDLGLDMWFAEPRIKLNNDDILKISVYCDNATLDFPCMHVKKVPTYDTINSSNVKEFFEEVECPKL